MGYNIENIMALIIIIYRAGCTASYNQSNVILKSLTERSWRCCIAFCFHVVFVFVLVIFNDCTARQTVNKFTFIYFMCSLEVSRRDSLRESIKMLTISPRASRKALRRKYFNRCLHIRANYTLACLFRCLCDFLTRLKIGREHIFMYFFF